ncbi:glycoside hydrolase family 43 protein [Myriangium duriaei CBS 260.36]|uniref:Glycoside hydrolase family 43 protein n=1 Tax=Myriangium duriaei CBS 260.36 TaxID=1168546 RepID=A0A9P4J7Q7_9PEZI|nr:glycoside hydrolase family 43 protein [Myriangium duriaei CBS 260.36]
MASESPLITHLYTADPSAHVFNGKIYIYPSHDIDAGIEDNDNGDQYAMNDYHVFSMPSSNGSVTDHGVVLSQRDIPWVSKQLWAPDAAEKDGKYYLYFPARDKDGIFRIGVAESSDPAGPFTPDPDYIQGTFSIDPASFVDDDGAAYLYVGGIWGGQLQCWQDGQYDEKWSGPQEPSGKGVYALNPRVAKLSADMHHLAEDMQEVEILAPETGKRILADDHDRRFFEGAWVWKHSGKYYFSYSTGDTHYLVYATSDNPYGPFTYAGRILEPVVGWTTHHSIVEHEGKILLFYHDSSLSGGKNHLRSVKVKEIFLDGHGKIIPTSP